MKNVSLFVLVLLINVSFVYAQEFARVRDNGKFGFIDTSGAVVVPLQFEKAGDFSNGYAAAFKEDKWGFINTSGEWVIQPTYDRVKAFNSGYALVLKDDQWRYIDASEKELTTPVLEKYYDFDVNGFSFYRIEGKVGLMNTEGKVFLEPTYDEIKPFVDGFARVKNNDSWGMIDTSGKVTVPVEYSELGDYSSKAIWAAKGESYGVLVNGTFTIVSNADKIWDFSEDSNLTYARSNDKIGFINTKGEWIIVPAYDKARAFVNGLAPVSNDKKWGYINESGEQVIDFNFYDAETFSKDGLAPVKEKKLWGFIDASGKMVIPAEYKITAGGLSLFSKNNLKGFRNGLARVKLKKGWGFITKTGEPLAGKWYENAENFSK